MILDKARLFLNEFETEIGNLSTLIKPEEWAYESFEVSKNTTYPHMIKTTQADEQYVDLTFQTCKKRVVLGGLRLANLVISIYSNSSQMIKEAESYDKNWIQSSIRGKQLII